MATHYAASAGRTFPDGVHFVELGGVGRPDLVPQAVAVAVGVKQQPDVSLEDTLADALRDKDTLLVLDNCEHLVEACSSLVATLLRRCPRTRVLATSRETMRLPGEKVFPLTELDVPDAMRLFADRALGVSADFAVTPDNRDTVRSICERLDNLPLAVELAARLVRLLPLDDILNRLQDRFALLTSVTSGVRSADTRHRSLYAAIDWSYDLLSPTEQTLLRRLSVLPGGFDIELAATVSAGLGTPVIELIAALESKSLVTAVRKTASASVPATSAAGGARFRQLESVRAYAREQLVACGELPRAAEDVVAALTALASSLTEQFSITGRTADRLFAEQDNLLFAIEYLRGRADPREPLLAAMLVRSRTSHGIVSDNRELLAAALRVENVPPAYRALALEEAAWQAAWHADHDGSLAFAREAASLAQDGSPSAHCRSLTALAFAHLVRGENGEAATHFAACLERLRDFGDPSSVALCRHNLAWATMMNGDPDRAAALLDEALPVYRRLHRAGGEPTRMASILHTAGTLEVLRGDLQAANAQFTAGLRALCGQRSRPTPDLLEGLAIVALRTGRAERGLRLAGAAESVRRALSLPSEPWWRQQVADAVDTAGARLRHGEVDRALAHGRRLPDAAAVDYALRQGQGQGDVVRAMAGPSLVSEREREVATLVAQGSTNVEIAARLRISERTVESHLASARAKLDLRSRAHLAAWAAQHLPRTG